MISFIQYLKESKLTVLPKYLYHATYRPLLKSIKDNGLGNTKRKNWEDSQQGVVYLAVDKDVAISYAETSEDVDEDWLDEIIVLTIDVSRCDKNKFQNDRNVRSDNISDDERTIEYHGIIQSNAIINFKDLISENSSNKYYFSNTCVDFEDGNEVYEITNFDEWANNKYSINDEALEDGTIKILTKQEFDKLVDKNQPRPKSVEYYAINTYLDIVYAYDGKNDVHWFYNP